MEKLFWVDPYLTSCSAIVTSVSGEDVTLDRTVAFAESGGQESDTGTIGGFEILSATVTGREIAYRLTASHTLVVGGPVTVTIDWPRRYRLMRLHFAAELVLELVNQLFDRPHKTGAHISAEKGRIDFAWSGNISETFGRIAAGVQALVDADLPITSTFSDEKAERRFWEIEGFARVPCSGTHLRRTGEVGVIALARDNRGMGAERIEIRLEDPDVGLAR